MRKLALLASLALAGGTLTASAEPQWRDRDHRRDGYGYRDNRDNRWRPIAQTQYARSDSQQILLYGNHPRYRALRIQAVRGAPVIQAITIQYINRPAQYIKLHQRIVPGNDEIIRLDSPAKIQRVIVYTEGRYGGAYTVLGA
jgi:hypothetical protein